jgi:HK97 family phage portal protein
MRVFGFVITRTKAASQLQSVEGGGQRGWFNIVRESYAGAWQNNVEVSVETVLSHPIVYACISMIASDIGKLGGPRLVQLTPDGIWVEADNPAFSPFLRRPNRYQNRIQFWECWMFSKMVWGNTYAVKQRDNRGVVVASYVLDPQRVRVLVAPDGGVYYELKRDDLSGLHSEMVYVPASEMYHDRMNCFYHPLVGLGPVYANGLAASMGLNILNSSSKLFANSATPGGVLTAPGLISQATAERVKAKWEAEYSGDNVGKIAVLGDGLKFEPMAMKAVDSQTKEQADHVSHLICSAFQVPAYMVGVGAMPLSNNVEALIQEYYARCLQKHIESIEMLLDEEIPRPYGTEFDLDNLWRMDTATLMKAISDGVGAGVMKPNEGRLKLNMAPVPGGNTPYMQVQNYSLEALNKRDQAMPAPGSEAPTPAALPAAEEPDETPKYLAALMSKALEEGLYDAA